MLDLIRTRPTPAGKGFTLKKSGSKKPSLSYATSTSSEQAKVPKKAACVTSGSGSIATAEPSSSTTHDITDLDRSQTEDTEGTSSGAGSASGADRKAGKGNGNDMSEVMHVACG